MTHLMQQGPSSSDKPDPFTQGDGDQLSQPISQFDFLNHTGQALSYLRAGFRVEAWVLNIIWPGICTELLWYDWYHPGTLSSAETTAICTMSLGQNSNDRRFDCPVFVAQTRHGWPRTCNNIKSANMADVRRHLTTRPGRGYTPQLAFLGLCPTCNNDFIEKEVFESRHGYNGELCNNRQSQRRGANAQVQWQLLYHQIEAVLASQHLQTRPPLSSNNYENGLENTIQEENDYVSALPGPNAGIPIPSASHNIGVEPLAAHPNRRKQKEAMPYSTPYELIVDSDSDDRESDTEPQNTSSSIANGTNQHPPSGSWLEISHELLNTHGRSGAKKNDMLLGLEDVHDTRPRDPGTPRSISRSISGYWTLNTQKDVEKTEIYPARRVSAVSQHSTFGENSKATSPPVSNTTPWQIQDEIVIQPDSPDAESWTVVGLLDGVTRRRTESRDASTADHDDDLSISTQRRSYVCASTDRSTPGHFRLTKSVEPFDPGGDDRAKDSTTFSRHTPTVLTINPPDLPTVTFSLADEESKSSPSSVRCILCDTAFTGKFGRGNLRRHRRQYHMIRPEPLPCSYCSKTFRRSDARRKHYRSRHLELPIPESRTT